ncbi:MAG TPA: diacylglycerol kinase family protein, partial [Armatimonadota bacterium]|nr:diacylglycerol kinase family protein [Armatimonadota bacterium]
MQARTRPGAGSRPTATRGAGRELLILANRRAGSLARAPGETPLEQFAREAGFEPRVLYTRSAAQLRRILREEVVGRRGRVAVAGGDGTIHSAVQELARTDVALGVLPQGTANNFATALRLPRDLPSAFRVIAEGEERTVSLGLAGAEYFTEAAGAGIFADVLALTSGRHGPLNALRALGVALQTMLAGRFYRFSLEVDGERRVENALSITVANSFSVGYNLPIAPCATLTDRVLDVVIIGALSRSELLPYFRAV